MVRTTGKGHLEATSEACGSLVLVNVFLEECAETLKRDRLPFVLIANQAHSIAEKCGFVRIGEPRAQRVLRIGRAPGRHHMVMGCEYVAVRVSRPTAIQDSLVLFTHLPVCWCQRIPMVNHHGVNNDPDQ